MNGLNTNSNGLHRTIMVLIIFLCVTLFDWNGYGYYVFYLPFLYLLFKGGLNQIDSNFKLLFLFGLSYSVIDFINTGRIVYVYNILPVFNFPMAYLMGKMIADNKSLDGQVSILWIFAMSMAFLTMLSTYVSFLKDGFALVGRDIKLIGYSNEDGEILYSATGLYSKLLPLTLFASFLFLPIYKKNRWLFFTSACVAFFCCLRLQSRSAIYVTMISLVIPFLLGEKDSRINKIFGAAFIGGIVIYILANFSDELMIIDRFQNNSVFENEGGDSRMDLAIKTLNDLLSHPFGGLASNRFAHNLWIDSARVGGWIPAFFLIGVTWKWIKTTFKIYRNKKMEEYYRIFIVVVSVCLFMYFNTEPIMEGAAMLFTFFCLYFGIITKSLSNYQSI